LPILPDHLLLVLEVAQVVANQPNALLGIRSGSVRLSLGTYSAGEHKLLCEIGTGSGADRQMDNGRNVMKMNRNHIWLLLPVLMLAAGSVFAKQHDVTECGTEIDQPGKYRLMNDMSCAPDVSGVWITAPDVTLDLRGHTISCDASGDELVAAVIIGGDVDPPSQMFLENVRVRNGTASGCDDGILLWFSVGAKVSKMNLENNIDGGITLVVATNSEIKHNRFITHGIGIGSWWGGSGNLIKGNYISYVGSAIDLNQETDSNIKCNIVEQSFFGISAGPYSTGNTLQGNLVIDGFSGIMLYGVEHLPVPPDDPEIAPVASGNLVKHNVALGNFMDMSEIVYVLATGDVYVDPGDTCQNSWMNNQFGFEMGPSNCIGLPVELDEDDVCALDADD